MKKITQQMKKMTRIILPILFSVVTITSCKKPTDQVDDPVVEVKNKISLHFMNKWGMNDDFAYNTVYDINGVNVKFTDFRYYLSNFEMHDDADNPVAIEGKVLLVDAGSTEHVELGEVSKDFTHIHEMHFMFGLDTITNHIDPVTAPAPLNDASMHWTWAPEQGYKFMLIEGQMDPDGDGTYEDFAIHLATDNLSRSISKEVHKDIENNSIMLMTMVNYQMLFTDVDFTNLTGTHGDHPLTNGIADKVGMAINIME